MHKWTQGRSPGEARNGYRRLHGVETLRECRMQRGESFSETWREAVGKSEARERREETARTLYLRLSYHIALWHTRSSSSVEEKRWQEMIQLISVSSSLSAGTSMRQMGSCRMDGRTDGRKEGRKEGKRAKEFTVSSERAGGGLPSSLPSQVGQPAALY